MRIKVDLGTSPTVPMRLQLAEGEMIGEVAERMAREIGAASGSSRIAAGTNVTAKTREYALILIGAGVPFARIRDRGGTIFPRRRKVLRFANGEFRPRARQEGNQYIARGVNAAASGIGADYSQAFGVI